MKKTTLLFTLAISATLMIVSTGCKHKPVNGGNIDGLTRIPGLPSSSSTNWTPTQIPNPNAGRGGIDRVPRVESPTETGIGISNPTPQIPTNNPEFRDDPKWGPVFTNGTRDVAFFEPYTIHFDLDSAVIKSGDETKLEYIAGYYKTNTTDVLLVEGHCDERGTEQYNLALGDRRALAVREYLIKLGVDSARINTVSFGETRPLDPGHNEAAWAKNRRGAPILIRATDAPKAP